MPVSVSELLSGASASPEPANSEPPSSQASDLDLGSSRSRRRETPSSKATITPTAIIPVPHSYLSYNMSLHSASSSTSIITSIQNLLLRLEVAIEPIIDISFSDIAFSAHRLRHYLLNFTSTLQSLLSIILALITFFTTLLHKTSTWTDAKLPDPLNTCIMGFVFLVLLPLFIWAGLKVIWWGMGTRIMWVLAGVGVLWRFCSKKSVKEVEDEIKIEVEDPIYKWVYYG